MAGCVVLLEFSRYLPSRITYIPTGTLLCADMTLRKKVSGKRNKTLAVSLQIWLICNGKPSERAECVQHLMVYG